MKNQSSGHARGKTMRQRERPTAVAASARRRPVLPACTGQLCERTPVQGNSDPVLRWDGPAADPPEPSAKAVAAHDSPDEKEDSEPTSKDNQRCFVNVAFAVPTL